MKLFLLVAVSLLLLANPARAVVGIVDVNDEFPFVVKIDLGGGYCSGAVTVDNLVTTAAHCVWDDETKIALSPDKIRISYVDMDGNRRATGVSKIFFLNEYRSTKDRKHIPGLRKCGAQKLTSRF
jgi:V8-like Glu-specific endopeptidase